MVAIALYTIQQRGSGSIRAAALARSVTQDLQALAARARLVDGAMNIKQRRERRLYWYIDVMIDLEHRLAY